MVLVLVTGASTGLGLATATTLAGQGHDVMFHARHPSRIEDPAMLRGMHAVVYGDLSDRKETEAVAAQANRLGQFDAIIHNAGIMSGPNVYAVNVVAPYLLSALTEPAHRSIVLSSSMHHSGVPALGRVDFADASGDANAYQNSKLYVTAFAMALAQRHHESLWHAVDPGWVPTRMGGPHASDDFDAGHQTQEWLATAPEGEVNPRTGGYWYHRKLARPHPAAVDPGFHDELLVKLAAFTGIGLS